jgi:hypothetical protein
MDTWSRHGDHLGASLGEMDGIGAIDPNPEANT